MTISAPAALFPYCNENISTILALSIVKITAYQYNYLSVLSADNTLHIL